MQLKIRYRQPSIQTQECGTGKMTMQLSKAILITNGENYDCLWPLNFFVLTLKALSITNVQENNQQSNIYLQCYKTLETFKSVLLCKKKLIKHINGIEY